MAGAAVRVNVIGLLRQSADTIEHRRRDDGAYAFMLSELAEHLAAVRDGKHTWDEFAEAYCLTVRDRANATASAVQS